MSAHWHRNILKPHPRPSKLPQQAMPNESVHWNRDAKIWDLGPLNLASSELLFMPSMARFSSQTCGQRVWMLISPKICPILRSLKANQRSTRQSSNVELCRFSISDPNNVQTWSNFFAIAHIYWAPTPAKGNNAIDALILSEEHLALREGFVQKQHSVGDLPPTNGNFDEENYD